MKQLEFDSSLIKFKNQFHEGVISPSRATMVWHRWKKLPDGVFESAIEKLIYRGGIAPNGDALDLAVESAMDEYRAKTYGQAAPFRGCDTCSERGYVEAFGAGGNSCLVACQCELGRHRLTEGTCVTEDTAINNGYTRFKFPLSFKVKRHKDWIHADRTNYSAKLIAIFNTVQRSLLAGDSLGLRGVGITTGLTEDEAFKIYELMRAGNVDDLLIRTNNNDSTRIKKENFRNV